MLMLGSVVGQNDTFQLKSETQLRKDLRKYRSKMNGGLDTSTIPKGPLQRALKMKVKEASDVFEHFTEHNPNTYSTILDTGASMTAVPDKNMCEPGSIRKLPKAIELDGIAGGLMIEYTGRLKAETIDKNGNVFPFETTVMINDQLPGILVSPQALLFDQRDNLDDHFRVYHNRVEWHARNQHLLDIHYDSSFLPRFSFFQAGKAEESLKAFHSSVHSTNKNLTTLQKIWLKWHTKMGHLSFPHVQKLAIGGFFDKHSLALSTLKSHDHPQCEACKYGKQARRPDGINNSTKKEEKIGSLKQGKLNPGQTIYMDQLESRVRGRLFHTAGREPDRDKFCGTTVFCDGASGYIHVEHQVTLNASDTINAKTSFERAAMDLGVTVESYHTDNGIFNSHAFTKELAENYQSVTFSGVGAKWQAGVAENAIKIVSTRARTMMIYANLMWPEVQDEALWPLAVSHAVYLYNHTPNMESGIAPIELFSQTVNDGQALRNAHPWGCPAYVLEPKLTAAGGKLPKWSPRSRHGQFVGVSPVHAENIAVIRNLKTGYLSPQYHIVFDDWFETVYASDDDPPPQWADMCIFQRFETQFDEDVQPPLLSNEWLTPEEVNRNKKVRRLNELKQGRKLYHELSTKDQEREDPPLQERNESSASHSTREQPPPAEPPTPSSTREPSSPREPPTPREPHPTKESKWSCRDSSPSHLSPRRNPVRTTRDNQCNVLALLSKARRMTSLHPTWQHSLQLWPLRTLSRLQEPQPICSKPKPVD